MQLNKELKDFEETYKRFENEFLSGECREELAEMRGFLKIMVDYNCLRGKHSRGLAVVSTYKLFNDYNNIEVKESDLELVRIMGWTVEILQGYLLMVDDMMDHSIMRRNKLCWYKNETVGLLAVNDATILKETLYSLIRKYFSGQKYYINIMELIHEVTRLTSYGQHMDSDTTLSNGRPDINRFTEELYDNIAEYKTTYYTFILPVRLALYMSGCDSESEHKLVKDSLLKLGRICQIQDDILDVYGDPEVMGKIGTDIQEGKCSWLTVMALRLSNERQKRILTDNLGINDPECVLRVKEIYNELKLKEHFEKEEESQFRQINQSIIDLKYKNTALNPEIFKSIVNLWYKRVK